MVRSRPQTTSRVWLFALVPYVALSLTAAFPHAHTPCAPVSEHVDHQELAPCVFAHVGVHAASEAPCPLCQWQATSKPSPSAPLTAALCELLPVGAVALLPERTVAWAQADVPAARAPPAVPA